MKNAPSARQAFCGTCQQWLSHRCGPRSMGNCSCLVHTCFDRADLKVNLLILARMATGSPRRPYHLALAQGWGLTAEHAICGIGPVDLAIDRAQWPLPIEYHLMGICKNCMRQWLKV